MAKVQINTVSRRELTRRRLFDEADNLRKFIRNVEPTSDAYQKALYRLNEINSQLYR